MGDWNVFLAAVVMIHPGDCPRCGMSLEPLIPELDEEAIATFKPNMWTLISLGTGAAFVYSVVATECAARSLAQV